ncbi:hypothetical protein CHARACLAT_021196, partial [Characodon lateralis]|nr:hypothetical protein [Characodon lateralis]
MEEQHQNTELLPRFGVFNDFAASETRANRLTYRGPGRRLYPTHKNTDLTPSLLILGYGSAQRHLCPEEGCQHLTYTHTLSFQSHHGFKMSHVGRARDSFIHRVHPQFTPKEPQKPLSHHAEHLGREGSMSLQPIMMQLIECLKRHEGPDHRDHIHLCRYRRGGPQQSVRFRGGPVCRIHVDGERGGVQQT